MYHYILIDSDRVTPLRYESRTAPFPGYNDIESSKLNGKPFYVPATEMKPALGPNQKHTGPTLEYVEEALAGQIVWGVEDVPVPTPEERIARWLAENPFADALIRALNRPTTDAKALAPNKALAPEDLVGKIKANLP